MNQQTWRVDLQILAARLEVVAVWADSGRAPLSTRAQVTLKFRATIDAFLPPSLRNLSGIDERLKDALGWRGNVNLADEFVCTRTDS